MQAHRYRYFLGFRPDLRLRGWLARLSGEMGQVGRRIEPDRLHLTMCVLAETDARDPFMAARVSAALDGWTPSACPIRLGRVRASPSGAMLLSLGRQPDIQAFYRELLDRLAARGLFPLHRASGLRPHVTLGYDPCALAPLERPREWTPEELLLIESDVGRRAHSVLDRWPLLPPRQGSLPFGMDCTPPAPAAGRRL